MTAPTGSASRSGMGREVSSAGRPVSVFVDLFDLDGEAEPTSAELEAIEAEWPVLAAEMAVVAAECRVFAEPRSVLARRALRRAVAARNRAVVEFTHVYGWRAS